MKIQKYEVRLKKCGVLKVSDIFPTRPVQHAFIAAKVFEKVMKDLPHEEMWVLGLSSTLEGIGLVRVSMGGVAGTALSPKDIFRPLVVMGANSFVLAHNHPSGNGTPSHEDIATTKKICAAGEMIGIYMMDHLVIPRGKEYLPISIRERYSSIFE